jgi:hypothetical protein
MTNINDVVHTYIEGWNEPDPQRRRALVGQTWTDDARYVDPHFAGEGADGIAAMIGGVQEQFPGHRFELVDGPDAHHDRVRFTWHLQGPDGPVAVGTDFGTIAEDGRLREVTGFLALP